MTGAMVRVPPDGPVEVELADRRSGRSWTVEVAPFEIATTVVTAQEWARTLDLPLAPFEPEVPRVGVSWRDAVGYCNARSRREGLTPAYTVVESDPSPVDRSTWVPHDRPAPDDWQVTWERGADGYRLPTEAEWLVACRAGTTGARYAALDEIAWYDATSRGRLHAVGTLRPNAWGLHDTLGGVWEWCWERADPEVYGTYRVIRGGDWADPHWSCRAGVRRRTNPAAELDDLGLRLARSVAVTP